MEECLLIRDFTSRMESRQPSGRRHVLTHHTNGGGNSSQHSSSGAYFEHHDHGSMSDSGVSSSITERRSNRMSRLSGRDSGSTNQLSVTGVFCMKYRYSLWYKYLQLNNINIGIYMYKFLTLSCLLGFSDATTSICAAILLNTHAITVNIFKCSTLNPYRLVIFLLRWLR